MKNGEVVSFRHWDSSVAVRDGNGNIVVLDLDRAQKLYEGLAAILLEQGRFTSRTAPSPRGPVPTPERPRVTDMTYAEGGVNGSSDGFERTSEPGRIAHHPV